MCPTLQAYAPYKQGSMNTRARACMHPRLTPRNGRGHGCEQTWSGACVKRAFTRAHMHTRAYIRKQSHSSSGVKEASFSTTHAYACILMVCMHAYGSGLRKLFERVANRLDAIGKLAQLNLRSLHLRCKNSQRTTKLGQLLLGARRVGNLLALGGGGRGARTSTCSSFLEVRLESHGDRWGYRCRTLALAFAFALAVVIAVGLEGLLVAGRWLVHVPSHGQRQRKRFVCGCNLQPPYMHSDMDRC